MKKILKISKIFTGLTIGVCLIVITAEAQPSAPGNHGSNGNQPAGAPIDGGLGILLALGAAYGGRKVYRIWKQGDRPRD